MPGVLGLIVPDRARILVRRLHPAALLPSYARPGDAGADLAAVATVVLAPGERALVPTGVALALPEGLVGLVHPRSGLAAKHGLSIVNAPGTVDSGYRGEILVNLINLDREHSVTIEPGDRIAQLVIQHVVTADFEESDSLPSSDRGDTGHGSTGGLRSALPFALHANQGRAQEPPSAPTSKDVN